jgi:hypothetical protein
MNIKQDRSYPLRATDEDTGISIESSGFDGDLESIYFRFLLPQHNTSEMQKIKLPAIIEQDIVDRLNRAEKVKVAVWRRIKIPASWFKMRFSRYITDNNMNYDEFRAYIIKYLETYIRSTHGIDTIDIVIDDG